MMFLTAGFVILIVMLIFFGGGLYTSTYSFDRGRVISYNLTGAVLVGPEYVSDVTRYDIAVNTSYTKGSNVHEAEGKRLFNGLLFGSNNIIYHLEADGIENMEISFEVVKTNSYAPLIIKVNDEIIENREFAAGDYTTTVDRSLLSNDATIEFIAASSTWKLWAPTVYELDNVKIVEKSYSRQPNEFKFVLRENEYTTFREGRVDLKLDNNIGSLEVEMNDNPVHNDVVSDYQSLKFSRGELLIGENVLQMRADVNSVFSGKATMLIFYKTQMDHILEMKFNLTETEYNLLDSGTISFDIVDVEEEGGFSVKIFSGSEETFSQYSTVYEQEYEYSFGKADVREGTNRVLIQSVDDAAFYVKNLEVKY